MWREGLTSSLAGTISRKASKTCLAASLRRDPMLEPQPWDHRPILPVIICELFSILAITSSDKLISIFKHSSRAPRTMVCYQYGMVLVTRQKKILYDGTKWYHDMYSVCVYVDEQYGTFTKRFIILNSPEQNL
jgi:hypothetical protein